MLLLPRSCFLHVPKTGGNWVKQAIAAAGIPGREVRRSGTTHLGRADCPQPEKFLFAFVRHPLDLYRSYWQYKMGTGWDAANAIDRHCSSPDFHEFVRRVIAHYPGVLGQSLEAFVGPPADEIDFVGRYEKLADDLVRALELAGESFDEAAIRTLPPVNVSRKDQFPATYTPALERALREVEAATLERFGYD